MFRDAVSQPISPIPVEYVNNLSRIAREPDYSLSCLGIAMLRKRIPDYGGFSGTYVTCENKSAALEDFKERVKTIDTLPLFCYYIYNNNDVEIEDCEGCKEKVQVSSFIKEKTSNECQVMYHETKNAVGIFVNTRDMKIYHLLLSFISLYYPSLFKEQPMKEEDYNIVKSLSKTDKTFFFGEIKKAVKEYEAEFRHIQLSILLAQMHETVVAQALNEVDTQRSNIRDIERRYAQAIAQLKDLIVRYEGLKATENHDQVEKDLIEYLTDNKFVNNIRIENNCLYFDVAANLTNYNENAWRIFSDRGHIYDGEYHADLLPVFKSRENRKLLLDNIFSEDPKIIVKMCGNYRLDMRDCSVHCYGDYDYICADPMYKSYIPNPHIKNYECLGGYKDKVSKALFERNFIAAIELCIASTGSVNIEETEQNFRPFIGWIMSSTEKVLKKKDGTEMTPEEALLWLHDEVKE